MGTIPGSLYELILLLSPAGDGAIVRLEDLVKRAHHL